MNKKIVSMATILVLVIFPLKTFAQTIEEILSQIQTIRTEIIQIQNSLEELKKKEISLSSEKLEPGDVLIIKVKTQLQKEPIGKLGRAKIIFLKTDDGWLGISGIDAKEKPGKYNLVLEFQDGSQFKEKIEIKKREFKISPFYLTKELIEKGYTQLKIVQNLKYKDNPSISKVIKIFEPFPYFKEPFIYPLKEIKVTGEFGEIKKYKNVSYQHLGVDLMADEGTPVFAINDGICQFSKELPNYGKTTLIDHGLGIYSLYLHLNEFKLLKGQEVKAGDIIGFSGNTGYSIEPHLHFSVKVNGASVDPLRFIEMTQKEMK